jgi:hypothetical protein
MARFPMLSFVGSSLVESISPVEVALNIAIIPTPEPLRGFGIGIKSRFRHFNLI